jgi:hypothetical protein
LRRGMRWPRHEPLPCLCGSLPALRQGVPGNLRAAMSGKPFVGARVADSAYAPRTARAALATGHRSAP